MLGDAAVEALKIVGVLALVCAVVGMALLVFAAGVTLTDLLDKRVRLRPWVIRVLHGLVAVVAAWLIFFVLELASASGFWQ